MALAEAARARAEAREAREAAREAREVAREERELFAYRAGKVKEALHPSMLATAILLAFVICFTLHARWWHFSLDEGEWVTKANGDAHMTFSAEVFLRTLCSFFTYSVVHIYLLAQMRIVGPRAPKLFSPSALVLICVGITYFLTYVTLCSCYGPHSSDWAAMGGFSIALFMMTLAVTYWSPKLHCLGWSARASPGRQAGEELMQKWPRKHETCEHVIHIDAELDATVVTMYQLQEPWENFHFGDE